MLRKYFANYLGLSIACWQSIFLTFIESFASGIYFFLSLYFVNSLNISIADAGILISFYGIGTICGGILGGRLSDYWPTKNISILSLLIQSIAFILLTKLRNENLLMVNMFVMGLCTYIFMVSNNVWMIKQCNDLREMRLKSINISRAASNLGMGLSGVLIGMLDVGGFHLLFYFSSIILILSVIYFHFFVYDNLAISNQKQNLITEIKCESNLYPNNSKIIFLMLGCLFSVGLIIAQLSVTYPLYIQHTFPQMGMRAVSILFVLDTLLIVIFQAPLVNLLNSTNKIFQVWFGALLMGIGMFILNFSFIFSLAIISCLIWTTGEMIFIAMAQLVCYECGSEKKKGQTMGIFQAVSAFSRIVGPSIGGFIYYYFSSSTLWSLSLVIGILCFLACNYFKKYDFHLIADSDTTSNKRSIASETSF